MENWKATQTLRSILISVDFRCRFEQKIYRVVDKKSKVWPVQSSLTKADAAAELKEDQVISRK